MMTRSLITLAATLTCTATASNPTWKSAAATLQENPHTHSNGVRRRLPSMAETDREVEKKNAQIAKKISEMAKTVGRYLEEERDLRAGLRGGPNPETLKKMAEIPQEKTDLETDIKEIYAKENRLQKIKRGVVDYWKKGAVWKGLITTCLAGGMGAGTILAAMYTKAGFKDFGDLTDKNGLADKPHMFGAMGFVALFFVFYLATIYMLFGGGDHKTQFWILSGLGFVGSALACSGMATMMCHNPEISSYGQSLIFGNGEAVTLCFSIGWICLAAALVLGVIFLARNKCSKGAAQ